MAPKNLGLDDPNRVQKIYHRGEIFDPARSHTSQGGLPRRSTPNSARRIDTTNLFETIGTELDNARVQCGFDFDSEKSFIPRNAIARILSLERVRDIISCLKCFRNHPDKDKLLAEIYSGSEGHHKAPCLKLLAVLIGINKEEDMSDYMSDGMNDDCLPLSTEPDDKNRFLVCQRHGTLHRTVNKYGRPNKRIEFAQWSYSLASPFIQGRKQTHSHYVLDAGDVLPMRVVKKIKKEDTTSHKDFGRPLEANSVNTYGGFSDVYRVIIDKSHHDFGEDHGMRHPEEHFALKKLTSHSRDNFNLELSSLLFSMDQYSPQKKRHEHLIQLLATFEVQNIAVQGSTYYLLFDWAEGTLSDFWHKNRKYVNDKRHCLWMAQQFHEISVALSCVHNERLNTITSLKGSRFNDEGLNDEGLYGRHGDIKPGNLLWFRSNSDSLVLSDFGLGRLHTQVSRSKQIPGLLDRSPTYRAPEFDLPKGMVSRVSDIFSLGCVWLEYVTWFMRGVNAMETVFPDKRMAEDVYGFESDTFFTIRKDDRSGAVRPELKPVVREWIRSLQKDEGCSWFLYQLLDIIRDDMLNPYPKERIESANLTKKMRNLQRTCEDNDSFYLKTRKES